MRIIKFEGGQLKEDNKEDKAREIPYKPFILRKAVSIVPKLFRQYYSINEAIKVNEEDEKERLLNLYVCILYYYLKEPSLRIKEALEDNFYFLTRNLALTRNEKGSFIFDGKEFHCFNAEVKDRRKVGTLRCYEKHGIKV